LNKVVQEFGILWYTLSWIAIGYPAYNGYGNGHNGNGHIQLPLIWYWRRDVFGTTFDLMVQVLISKLITPA